MRPVFCVDGSQIELIEVVLWHKDIVVWENLLTESIKVACTTSVQTNVLRNR
jgi:hypothetical protein